VAAYPGPAPDRLCQWPMPRGGGVWVLPASPVLLLWLDPFAVLYVCHWSDLAVPARQQTGWQCWWESVLVLTLFCTQKHLPHLWCRTALLVASLWPTKASSWRQECQGRPGSGVCVRSAVVRA
jgi:hypothetical protein